MENTPWKAEYFGFLSHSFRSSLTTEKAFNAMKYINEINSQEMITECR
jgi:hypothetical protein